MPGGGRRGIKAPGWEQSCNRTRMREGRRMEADPGKVAGWMQGSAQMEHLCHTKECGLHLESSGEPWRTLRR